MPVLVKDSRTDAHRAFFVFADLHGNAGLHDLLQLTLDLPQLRYRTHCTHDTEILWRIVLPASMPAIWDTLRITMGWTWTYLVVAELVAAQDGLGRRIMDAQRYLATHTIIFGTIFIGLLGLVTDYLFKLAGQRMFGWAEDRQ